MFRTLCLLLILAAALQGAANRVYVHPFNLFAYNNFTCEIVQAQAHKPSEMLKPSPVDPQGSIEPDGAALQEESETDQAVNQKAAVLGELLNSLGLRLYGALRQRKATNTLFSPGNAFGILSTFYLGASNVTADSLQRLLGLSADTEKVCFPLFDGHKVLRTLRHISSQLNESAADEFRTRMWTFVGREGDLSREFVRGMQHFSDASFVRSVDFDQAGGAETQVNSFIQRTSASTVEQLFDDISPSTNLLFASSMHLKGRWRTAFPPEATSLQNFWVDDKTSVPVPLMSRVGNFMYVDDKATKSTVVKMPLKKKVYILTALPHKGTSLDHVEDQLSTKLLSSWKQQFKEGLLEVSLPKFSLNSTSDLKGILSDMKLSYLLGEGADFSRLSTKKDFRLDQVLSHVGFQVSEEGEEDPAGPVVDMVPKKFVVDRPFFFAVVEENSDAILLLGRISNPSL
ncbi:angiotensinogen [Brienomyrus brachyistius]|uniref:angiotensinogen n=1 Tax=Brienomyrus brachyistius TaxID=42636 RepID=UPI0020B1C8B3|nr:angiotensinogen [Brienomyrus brachyistius]